MGQPGVGAGRGCAHLPVPLMTTASQDDLLAPGERPWPGGFAARPAAVLSALEMAVSETGIPAVGFFAQVPPYASIGYAAASIALLERLGRHLRVDLPMDGLREEEREQRARYDAAVGSDAMLEQTVERLESVAGDIDEERAALRRRAGARDPALPARPGRARRRRGVTARPCLS